MRRRCARRAAASARLCWPSAAAAATKRPGKVGGFFSLLVRCVVQLVLGAWVGLHFSRVLPDAAAEAKPPVGKLEAVLASDEACAAADSGEG